MVAEDPTTLSDYDLLRETVEAPTPADRLALLAEFNDRVRRHTIDRSIYRVMGAVRCYDLDLEPWELREVVRWCVNRFGLSVPFWWADDEEDLERSEGME